MKLDKSNAIEKQLKLRSSHYIQKLINTNKSPETLILTAACDQGVIRNGGRRGSKWSPKSILTHFNRMTYNELLADKFINIIECSKFDNDFNQLQSNQINQISSQLQRYKTKKTLQIGGGHDHIYPYIVSLSKLYKKIHIINIDAHLDTRTDQLYHSGTPFRQLYNQSISEKNSFDLKITQIGIHPYANQQDNYFGLGNAMKIVDIHHFLLNLDQFKIENLDYHLVLSLDIDGLSSSTIESTSAVNHNGLPLELFGQLYNWYISTKFSKTKHFGIYEYNPVYDNLSCKGAKYLASLVYNFCFNNG